MPSRSTLPRPSGQPSPSSSRRRPDRAHPAPGEGVELVAEAVVAGPAPQQRDRARELDRLVGVSGVGVGAEVDRAVGDHLVHDLAAGAVVDLAHVAQRAQVVHHRLELAHRHARVGGVLAVGGEQPRVVGPARAQEAHRVEAALGRRVALARVGLADLEVLGELDRVGQVLLGPVDAAREQRVAGQAQAGEAGERLAPGHLAAQQPRGVGQRGVRLAPGRGCAVPPSPPRRSRACACRRPARSAGTASRPPAPLP